MRFGLSLQFMLLAGAQIVLTGSVLALVFASSPSGQAASSIAWGVALSLVPGMLLARTYARRLDRTMEELRQDHDALESVRTKQALAAKALVTSERLASMGQLAAGVAHEVNNPLTYVRANLGQLRSHWSEIQKQFEAQPHDEELGFILGEGEDLIDESLEGVERAVSIVRDIKGFAHSGSDDPGAVELNDLLDSVLRVASAQLGQGVQVEKHYAPSICVVGIGQQLKQVFLNLIVNASHAIDGEGVIRIETTEYEDRALVTVIDDGTGIEPDAIDSLFDPFFTTKPVGKGTGLGLSISHEIIERHGGEIRVTSRLGEGSTFSVHLPIDP